jgi:hypothetical protein
MSTTAVAPSVTWTMLLDLITEGRPLIGEVGHEPHANRKSDVNLMGRVCDRCHGRKAGGAEPVDGLDENRPRNSGDKGSSSCCVGGGAV